MVQPLPFGRGAQGQMTDTDEKFLKMSNAIWDLQQEVMRLRDENGNQNAVLADHDRALTYLDNENYERKFGARLSPSPPPSMPIPAIIPSFTDLEKQAQAAAWELIIAGISVFAAQGITGNRLADQLAEATCEVQRRTGINTGEQR